MNRNRDHLARWWIPVVGSLAVYLVPLVGPHAIWPVGASLAHAWTGVGDREPGWFAACLALALAAQAAVGLMLAWSLGGSRLRWLAWIPALPLLVAGLNLAYLVAIPSHFLIEPDTEPDLATWGEHCFVPGAALAAVPTTVNQSPAGVDVWWTQRPDGRHALLRAPDCAAVDSGLPVPTVQPGGRVDFMLGLAFSAPGGTAILERLVPSTSERTWWQWSNPSEPIAPIEQPELTEGAPILSDAADAVAWVQRVAGSGPPVLERVLVRPLPPSSAVEPLAIELAPFGPASYALLAVDTRARELALWRNDAPLLVAFDGQKRDFRFEPGPLRAQASTFLRHQDGWVAWDAYRDHGPYLLSWSLAAGSGTHRTLKGRAITSAAIDPAGTLIAVSESTTLNIGRVRDAVYVFRAQDGVVVFRVALPRYARSQVAFFKGGLFAYSDLSGTHLRKIPQ